MHTCIRFFMALALLGGALRLAAQDFVVVAHPDVPETTLSADDFSNILLGKKTTWGSGAIKLAVLAEGAAHEAVMKAHAQRTPDQFDKHWKKLVFTGKGTMPTVCKTEAELAAFVAKTPGAIGYVAPAHAGDAVKRLTVQ